MSMGEISKLAINETLLKEEFIELLYKEGFITKETSFMAKKLLREEKESGNAK